ncbi:Hypothetical predicted protein [Paramuricea clavata]|uniref:Uncharacterized protein n=1 Tax=Paramuricea clavata TaxID=317549 RepID=A0A7D9DMY0_PARCT|nr:Hypothetical predicted protein [Paramuricea clavata]
MVRRKNPKNLTRTIMTTLLVILLTMYCTDEDFVDNIDHETYGYGENNDFDNDYNDYSDADDDVHASPDDAIYHIFFEQLIEAREKSAKKERESRFIPSTRRYLNALFTVREKSINGTIIKNLLYLIRNIISGHISVNVADIDKELMRELLNKNTTKDEIRLHLIEDRRLHIYLRRALKVVEESKKNGRQCEKTNDVRQREIQQTGDNVTTSYPTTKHSGRYQPYPGRSRVVGKSRGYEEKQATQPPPVPDADGNDAAAAVAVGTVAYHRAQIVKHFKNRQIKQSAGGKLQLGETVTNISFDDLMKDLTHNYKKKKLNLNDAEQRKALLALRHSGMPASYIRNDVLHDKYRNLLQTPPRQLPTQHAPQQSPTVTPRLYKPVKKQRVLGTPRWYMG